MRPISGKRMCKILEALGWVHVRTRGSHAIFNHPERPGRADVPVHGNHELKPATQRSIMRQAGLTDEDL